MAGVFLDEKVLGFSEDISNRIRIGHIEGILKEPLQFSVEANWENIFNIGLNAAQKGLSLLNVGLLNTGIWTRKFYKGGSYLRINPKMRVINWDGNNDVIIQATALTNMCLPQYRAKSIDRTIDESGNLLDIVEENVGEIVSSFNKEGFKSTLHKFINEATSNSPAPVEVVISNFFKNVFIVESVQVEFSKEMTQNGPLYADFDITLSTPEVTTRGNSGLKQVGKKRFTTVNK